MDFEPINSDHAVQSAVFTVALDGVIPPSAVHALSGRKDLLVDLPAVQNPDAFELAVTGGPLVPAPRRIAGVQLAHLRPDGTPAWALRLMGRELVVECTRYTRWGRVWDTASRYLSAGIEVLKVGERRRKVAAVGYVIVDQFLANRPDYELGDLLRENRYLASNSFVAGPTWHNHVGWFEPVDPPQTWLNQLNIGGLRDPNTSKLIIQIAHNQEMRFPETMDFATLGGRLEEIMARLHANNKRVLHEILAPAMADKIGLGKNEQ